MCDWTPPRLLLYMFSMRPGDERRDTITEDHWRAPARLWPQGGWLQTRSEAAKQRRGERGARNPERESSGTDSVGAGLGKQRVAS